MSAQPFCGSPVLEGSATRVTASLYIRSVRSARQSRSGLKSDGLTALDAFYRNCAIAGRSGGNWGDGQGSHLLGKMGLPPPETSVPVGENPSDEHLIVFRGGLGDQVMFVRQRGQTGHHR